MKALAINSWQRVFESALSKDATVGLMLPMKRGTGYAKLSKLDNGAAVYGVWIALLQVAIGCVPRGTLIYTDKEVKAHDEESLALVTNFARRDIASAISALLDIGWLEWVEVLDTDQTAKASAKKEKLADILKEFGARQTYNGESLLEEWYNAVKGLGPKSVRHVFEETTPGISMPSAFVRARGKLGL